MKYASFASSLVLVSSHLAACGSVTDPSHDGASPGADGGTHATDGGPGSPIGDTGIGAPVDAGTVIPFTDGSVPTYDAGPGTPDPDGSVSTTDGGIIIIVPADASTSACNTLDMTDAPLVLPVATTTRPAPPTAGTIADGRYRLTSITAFGQPPSTERQRIVIDAHGGTLDTAMDQGDPVGTTRSTYALDLWGVQLGLIESCPFASTGSGNAADFTASPTSLVLYLLGDSGTDAVQVYTFQHD